MTEALQPKSAKVTYDGGKLQPKSATVTYDRGKLQPTSVKVTYDREITAKISYGYL